MEDMIAVVVAAKELNLTVDTLYKWGENGRISIIRENYHKRYISKNDLEKLKSEVLEKGQKRCKDCGFVGDTSEFAAKRLRCNKCYAIYQHDKRLRNIDQLRDYDRLRYTGERREKQKKTARDWNYNNQELVRDRVKVYHSKNKQHRKFYALEQCYGINKEQYEQMLIDCDGKCEICGDVPEKVCVDHDHTTGQIRGILCGKCNSAIGFLNDDINLVNSALKYLQRFPT